jgi:hypothetical protein
MPDRARHFQRVPENQPGYREANAAFLRAEIRETRERMSGTLGELSERLNPNRIKAQVKHNIREATVGRVENMARNAADRVNETGHGVIDKIRENPIPAAMIGVGLGWLLFGGRRQESEQGTIWKRSYTSEGGWEGTTGYIGDLSATTPRLAQDDANGGMGSTISHEPGVVDKVRDRVTGIGETVMDTTTGLASDARERVSNVAGRATETMGEAAHRARDRFDNTMTDNPVALGMVAMAVGMAAGLAIPESHRERELMGEYRDQLVGRVRETVEDTRERVQHVAQRVVEESKEVAREAVREEGLVS